MPDTTPDLRYAYVAAIEALTGTIADALARIRILTQALNEPIPPIQPITPCKKFEEATTGTYTWPGDRWCAHCGWSEASHEAAS